MTDRDRVIHTHSERHKHSNTGPVTQLEKTHSDKTQKDRHLPSETHRQGLPLSPRIIRIQRRSDGGRETESQGKTKTKIKISRDIYR